MLSLSRILLRYCQSAIVALALCLVPEVDAGLAQSVRDLTSELDIWVSQELIVPSAAGEVDFTPSQSPPESIHTPESDVISSPRLSPEHFFNQPTISSQLLLPPGEESVKLLLAPAPETSQLFLPAATETQLLLPAAPEIEQTERISRVAPITSQRFLPAATMPVGLLSPAQDSPTVNPLTIAIEEEKTRVISVESSPSKASVQEQVGRLWPVQQQFSLNLLPIEGKLGLLLLRLDRLQPCCQPVRFPVHHCADRLNP
jgi:hypothetical protein